MSITRLVEIAFDGGCTPINPGGFACWGYVIRVNGKTERKGRGCVGLGIVTGFSCEAVARAKGAMTTNNVAEYAGLLEALSMARDMGLLDGETELRARGDSRLVIAQVSGRMRCKADHLQIMMHAARDLLAPCGSWKLSWVDRSRNRVADGLCRWASKEAMGAKVRSPVKGRRRPRKNSRRSVDRPRKRG